MIDKSISINETILKSEIGESFDIIYRHLTIPAFGNTDALIVYLNGMIDTKLISDLMEYGAFPSEVKKTKLWTEICDAVVEGDTVLFVDNCDTALILDTRKYESRNIEEPTTESEIRGPRDGFLENIQINTALIRRRIKDYGLRFDTMKIGERTKTLVSVVYIQGLVNDELLNEVKSRLERITTDSILASSYIEEMIEDAPYSLFPTISSTERPDKACAAILEGRIVIMVDTTPFALIVPTVFWQFFLSGGDYYDRYALGTFIRWIRLLALFISTSASSIYVLLTSFHQEMLPTALALKIAAGREGVPFPAFLEILFMELLLEIMKEAGLRMPKPIGQTVSIVGTLVLGQQAVSAGFVGPTAVIIMAIAAISSFAIPSASFTNLLKLVKYLVLFSTAFFGLLGYLAAVIAVLLHLMSLRSFGAPYLAPVIPFNKNSIQDVFVRAPWWKMSKRPGLVRAKDSVRQSSDLKPKPPPQE